MQMMFEIEHAKAINPNAYVPLSDFLARQAVINESFSGIEGPARLYSGMLLQVVSDLMLGLFVARSMSFDAGLTGRRENVRKKMQNIGDVGKMGVQQLSERINAIISCSSIAGISDYPSFKNWGFDVPRESEIGKFIIDSMNEIGRALELTAQSLPHLRRDTTKKTASKLRAAALFIQAFDATPPGLESEVFAAARLSSLCMRKAQNFAMQIENDEETL